MKEDRKKIVVLYYHEVVPKGQGYSYQKIEEKYFDAQMQYLKNNGYTTIGFEDLDKPLPDRPVIITFDDGFHSVKEYGIPILKKYQFQATLFLAPKYINEKHEYYLTWEEVKELLREGAIEVGGHTYSHIDIRKPSKEGLEEEIKCCNDSIYENLALQPISMCFPYGTFNKKAVDVIRKCGNYRYLVASFFGRNKRENLEKHLVKRIGISNDDSMDMFIRKVQGKESYRGIVHLLRIFMGNIKKQYVEEYRIDF